MITLALEGMMSSSRSLSNSFVRHPLNVSHESDRSAVSSFAASTLRTFDVELT